MKRVLLWKHHLKSADFYHVGNTSSHSNTEVKQHWAWILLGWETLQGIPGSAGTYPPPPLPQRTELFRLSLSQSSDWDPLNQKNTIKIIVCVYHIDIESLQIRLLTVCYVPATSASLSRLLFLFLRWLLTVQMKQTRQAVHTFKQSIRCGGDSPHLRSPRKNSPPACSPPR